MPAKCLRMDEDGNLPICTQTGDGSWEVSYPVTGGPGDGVPGAFGAFFVMKVNERSLYTVMTTGVGMPGSDFSVWALNALTNSMMLTPC